MTGDREQTGKVSHVTLSKAELCNNGPYLSWNSTKTLIFAPMHRLKKHLADLGDDLLSPTSDVGSSDK